MGRPKKNPEPSPDEIAGSLQRETEPPVSGYLSTGCTLLDLAIADRLPGGVPVGRVTHLFGDESSGKSLIAQEVVGSAQRAGGCGVYEDVEATIDLGRAKVLHAIDVGEWNEGNTLGTMAEPMEKMLKLSNRFVYRIPADLDEFYDEEIPAVVKLVSEGKIKQPAVVVVDTFSALSCLQEQAKKSSEATYGQERAKMMSRGMRVIRSDLLFAGVTLLALDQARTNVAVRYGEKRTTSGGLALTFYSSATVIFHRVAMLVNTRKQKVGVRIGFKVKKNKIAPPFREGEFQVLFDYGIDDITSNVVWLLEQTNIGEKLLRKQGKTYSFDGQEFTSKTDLVKHIEGSELEAKLAQEVLRVWREVYKTGERKPRNRTK